MLLVVNVEEEGEIISKPTTRRPQTNVKVIKTYMKNALYLSVNLFSTKVLIGDTIFYSIFFSYWRRDRHFTWSSEPREGPAACRAKRVPSFLS